MRQSGKTIQNLFFDNSLDLLLEDTCNKDITTFFLTLLQEEEFSEFDRLALLVLTLSPDSVSCERGFSVMNYVEYHTALTDQTLNALMALALDHRAVSDFPYRNVL
jgi:hypothetical protein